MTRAELERALARLQEAGELTFVRTAWCSPEPGAKDDWRQVLSEVEVRELYRAGVAVFRVAKQLHVSHNGKELP